MKIAGKLLVDIPECEGFWCHLSCPIRGSFGCNRSVSIFLQTGKFGTITVYPIPGPTCPAFDSVPNPQSEIYPNRPVEEWQDHQAQKGNFGGWRIVDGEVMKNE